MVAANAKCFRSGRIESEFGPLKTRLSLRPWDTMVGDLLLSDDGTFFEVTKVHRFLEPDGKGDLYFNVDIEIFLETPAEQ